MAVFHFTQSGTRSSGASAADDWSLANCYPFSAWNATVGAAADGDSIIIDDVTHICTTALALNCTANSGVVRTITVKSRSGGTVLQLADATTLIFTHNDANDINTIILEDLIFDGQEINWTTTSGSPIAITQACPSLTLNRCTWKNFRTATAARTTGWLLRYAASSAPGFCYINDCVVEDCAAVCSGAFEGMFKMEDSDLTWEFDGITFSNVSVVTSGTGNNGGLIYLNNDSALQLSNALVEDVYMEAASGQGLAGLHKAINSPGQLTVDGLTVRNMQMHGLAATEGVVKVTGNATIRNVAVTELRRTGTANGGGNSVGGVVSVQGSSGVALIEDMVVRDSGGFFGTAFYNSGGGSLIARRVIAVNITDDDQVGEGGDPVNGIAFYSGGDGAATWEACYAFGCSGAAENGVTWYIHLAATGSSSKTVNIDNCAFVGNLSTVSQMTGKIMSLLADNTLTVNITNTLFDDGVNEFETVQSTGTLVVNGERLHITEGAAAVTETSGTVDLGTVSDGDPGIVIAAERYDIVAGSVLIEAGVGVAGLRRDAAQVFYLNPPSIGPFEKRLGRSASLTRPAASR